MITNAQLDLPSELEVEVCIVGGGPAGIVVALELARRGRQVALVEGGGTDSPGDGASIYQGDVTGRPYPLLGSRLRWLGGTSNHWGGWVKPLDTIDFEDKPHFPLPGWPFGASELAPWYHSAAAWCELQSDRFDLDDLGRAARKRLLDLPLSSGFVHHVFRFSPPTRFGIRYREDLERTRMVNCFVNLNAVSLEQSGDRVNALVARTLNGGECRIRAGVFVLAMGGIENARFLLNQDPVPGNQSGLVGRCFMDHYGFTPGKLLSKAELGYERGALPGRDVMVVIGPNRELIREEGMRNCCFLLQADGPDDLVGQEYWSAAPLGGDAGAMYRISMINEPFPHPESRIELSDERDALGLRRARLHWHLPPEEFEPVIDLFRLWAERVATAGLGRVRTSRSTPPKLDDHVGIGYHHMGTTRMSRSPDHGVTNSDGRCWDRENLFICGSSLFPHVGYSNPTLTIVALAARLADHVGNQLEAGT